jgi:hypothetical protein
MHLPLDLITPMTPRLLLLALALPACSQAFTGSSAHCQSLRACDGPDAGNAGSTMVGGAGGSAAGGAGGITGGNSGASGAPTEGGGQAAGDTGGGDTDAAPACNTYASPSEASCLVTDEYAVFVAPGANGDGNRASPVGSIAEGADRAADLGLNIVIVCGDHTDSLDLNADHSGLRIYGGFQCPGSSDPWSPSGAPSKVETAVGELPLSVDSVTGLRIADMHFVAADGDDASPNSVAAVVTDSTNVVLDAVILQAQNGASPSDAVNEGYDFGEMPSTAGNPAVGDAGGAFNEYTCPNGVLARGGHGGNGASDEVSVSGGGTGTPHLGGGAGGGDDWGVGQSCDGGGTGQDGHPGASPDAAPAQTALGALEDGRWVAASGIDGETGGTAQGGGGGRGGITADALGGGGGGGRGGCGGMGGPGGKGGGASIALIALASAVNLNGVTLRTANGGYGAAGANGQDGQEGGGGGERASSAACDGGNGGKGGHGAAGSGGAGGSVYGVLLKDATVNRNASTTIVHDGAPGTGGDGGGNAGNAGPDGEVLDVKDITE